MSSICWKSAVTWSLLGLMFLLFVLMWGPAPALAKSDAVLYEVTEDMYLLVRDTNGKVTGYVSDPSRATAEIGRLGADLIVARTVDAIRKAIASR